MRVREIRGTTHENAASGHRLCVGDGLHLSSIRYGVARLSEGRVETWALRLWGHSGELITISRPHWTRVLASDVDLAAWRDRWLHPVDTSAAVAVQVARIGLK
jgi:hypothetical protein